MYTKSTFKQNEKYDVSLDISYFSSCYKTITRNKK